jgi:Fic family protein
MEHSDATSFPPPETASVVQTLNDQIAVEQHTITQIEAALREHRQALVKLQDARRALVGKTVKSSFERAGRANIEKARQILQHNGPTAKAQVTRMLGINDGTVTYALRHLEEIGEARKTGERVRGSDVYEYVTKRAVTKPGERR